MLYQNGYENFFTVLAKPHRVIKLRPIGKTKGFSRMLTDKPYLRFSKI